MPSPKKMIRANGFMEGSQTKRFAGPLCVGEE
jgi:hypothetical protein